MEFIEGQSLEQCLRLNSFAPQETARLIAQIADAVAHLHGQGIIHRDLKPSNILLDDHFRPYVTDLGLAKALMDDSKETATGLILGTPCYMAPEQAAGLREQIGPLSDVYSLGALLYEMLTGRPPFLEATPMETVMKVIHGEPPGPRQISRDIPRQLELICLKCLAKAPQQRYATAEEVRDDLNRYLRGETVRAKPPSFHQATLRTIRRWPALSTRLGVLGVFLVVETINYRLGGVPDDFHRTVMLLMAIWAVISFLGQWLIATRRWVTPACFLWGTLDALMLHAVLEEAAGVASPLIVGYPILIAASAIWLHRRFVWYITVLCALSYFALTVEFYRTARVQQIYPGFPRDFDRHIIFLVMLLSLATLLCYLIRRIQSLNYFCGQAECDGTVNK
jgi:serine/threonine-protein kinase